MEPEAAVYERIVLKLSGEAMQQHGGRDNISPPVVREIAERLKRCRIWRGSGRGDRAATSARFSAADRA